MSKDLRVKICIQLNKIAMVNYALQLKVNHFNCSQKDCITHMMYVVLSFHICLYLGFP